MSKDLQNRLLLPWQPVCWWFLYELLEGPGQYCSKKTSQQKKILTKVKHTKTKTGERFLCIKNRKKDEEEGSLNWNPGTHNVQASSP